MGKILLPHNPVKEEVSAEKIMGRIASCLNHRFKKEVLELMGSLKDKTPSTGVSKTIFGTYGWCDNGKGKEVFFVTFMNYMSVTFTI